MNAVPKNQAAVMESEAAHGAPLHLISRPEIARGAFGTQLSTSTLVVAGCLVFFQILDGIFTSMGVARFGTIIEGNPLLRQMMEAFGHVPTLAVLKLIAIVAIIGLTAASHRMKWVHHAMSAVAGVYLFGAIIPWTYILFVQ